MLDRRQLLGAFLATTLVGVPTDAEACLFKRLRQRQQPCNRIPSISERTNHIVNVLRSCPSIRSVDVHSVDDPTLTLFQWQWTHFHYMCDIRYFPEISAVNEEIRHAMRKVGISQWTGLHKLLQEGLVKSKEEEYITYYRTLYAYLVEKVLHEASDNEDPIDPKRIERAMADGRIVTTPVVQSWQMDQGKWRFVELPILSRIGVGNALSFSDDIQLIPAEDPVIDRKAEWAERHGTQEDWYRWVMRNRNAWFVKCALRMREDLVHLLVGHDHDLQSDIQEVNDSDNARISHVVITPKSIGITASAQYRSTSNTEASTIALSTIDPPREHSVFS